jgi:hypothetical protein
MQQEAAIAMLTSLACALACSGSTDQIHATLAARPSSSDGSPRRRALQAQLLACAAGQQALDNRTAMPTEMLLDLELKEQKLVSAAHSCTADPGGVGRGCTTSAWGLPAMASSTQKRPVHFSPATAGWQHTYEKLLFCVQLWAHAVLRHQQCCCNNC